MRASVDGLASGLIGVVIFSGSLPATRVGVMGFSPLFLTSARAVIAGVLAAALLVVTAALRFFGFGFGGFGVRGGFFGFDLCGVHFSADEMSVAERENERKQSQSMDSIHKSSVNSI